MAYFTNIVTSPTDEDVDQFTPRGRAECEGCLSLSLLQLF